MGIVMSKEKKIKLSPPLFPIWGEFYAIEVIFEKMNKSYKKVTFYDSYKKVTVFSEKDCKGF